MQFNYVTLRGELVNGPINDHNRDSCHSLATRIPWRYRRKFNSHPDCDRCHHSNNQTTPRAPYIVIAACDAGIIYSAAMRLPVDLSCRQSLTIVVKLGNLGDPLYRGRCQ